MSGDNPWIMRRLGCWPQNRACSECSHFKPGGVSDAEWFEGAGRCGCNKNGASSRKIGRELEAFDIGRKCQREPEHRGGSRCNRIVVGEHFHACEYFKSHWQAERELLEQTGQKCIQFATRGRRVALGWPHENGD